MNYQVPRGSSLARGSSHNVLRIAVGQVSKFYTDLTAAIGTRDLLGLSARGCENEPSLLGGRQNMAKTLSFVIRLKIWKDTRGQDMLEYGCFMAAIVLLYAAFSPSVASGVLNVFTKISSNLATAAGV